MPGQSARRIASFLVAMLASFPIGVFGAESEDTASHDHTASETLGDDVALLASAIDEHIEAGWRTHNVVPAPLADDAEFLRRVSLDLAGRIPSVWDVREFLADDDPHKRRRVVDRLLESPLFYSHFAVKWRMKLVPQAGADIRLQFQIPDLDVWVRHKLVENVAYDQLVREILAFPIKDDTRSTAEIFYTAREAKPENLAAATSRLFLGVRLECAQCHDHPFSHWKQDEFWSLAAFFAGIQGEQNGRLTENRGVHTIQIPDSDRLVEARFLSGETPDLGDANPRQVLAAWLTSGENPYFARAAANRVWAELFGVGIVDPPDDFDEANPPSHPELLDRLAREFAAHEFDVPFLIRAITASRAYQLTSRQTDASQHDPRLFARRTARALSADQLYDSLAQATGYDDRRGFRQRESGIDSPRSRFRDLFENQTERPAESQATILQALAMMNGEAIQFATDASRSPILAAVLESPFFTDAERVETLCLATLSRPPRAGELERMTAYLGSGSDTQQHGDAAKQAAFADIFWALLNSSEFAVNH